MVPEVVVVVCKWGVSVTCCYPDRVPGTPLLIGIDFAVPKPTMKKKRRRVLPWRLRGRRPPVPRLQLQVFPYIDEQTAFPKERLLKDKRL